MLKTVVLLCSISTDPSACSRATAIEFVRLPTPTVVCGVGGEAANAGAGEVLRPEPGKSYLKIACERVVEAGR